MRRAVLALPVLAAVLALGACGGSSGGGDDDGGGKDADATPAPAEAAPSGFIATTGKGWTFARPQTLQPLDVEAPEGRELQVFQLGSDEDAGLPSQVAVGASKRYSGSLEDAVAVAKDTAKAKYNSYKITAQEPVELAGGRAFRVDATYESFSTDPVTVRSQNLYVRGADGLQLNLSVRGPDADFERLELDKILSSFRLR